ncbi:MAG: ABC transporter ATP-binding protein [Nitrososphaerota archaeon]|nr:ABC transporter ATP-binding protein [Nitrososphaerota archaeon]MDG7048452.1 ABC transporter ATP-binding protein [Nitrososphaerota archaeon]MDG7048535.1 ABC transporter ATP-binding protein [Nitrososphaerota archaeon]MDG7051066.1 ABC transporter ATP-binding protein [Nitrososphaerota archaeon]
MSIVTENLTKTFNGLVAVNGVSLKVTKGTIFGLLGPNGAGKSTFLRMICTVLRPTSGHGSIEGFDIVNDTNEVRKTIGVVQEKLLLYPTLTAIENLEFFGRLYGIRGKPLREKAEALIEEVKLTSVKDRPVGTYSTGMRQRINLVRALIHDPKVIILDEPTNGLDPQSVRWVRDYVKRLKERNLTVLVTTHDMHEAEELMDELAIMDRGGVLAVGRTADLKRSQDVATIEDLFLKLTGRELRDEVSSRLKRRGW